MPDLDRPLNTCIPKVPLWDNGKQSRPGLGCSKLTTSLVNVSLISKIRQHFFVEKMWATFAVQKLFSFFGKKSVNLVNIDVKKL